ncbi:hypothetical protein [Parafilimonas terrae]|uniref:Uncharacterized protein n=1 Tax=Parafilimonas terrae TaxID=1465490 RepID=A0A1I5XGH9_9BACT|nr:hypothetical protein [Parafilimonas terrae]SFQ30926.1 hypothetical protein SAMN05444277_108164 [Parafilimonas terrae]
MKKANGKSSQNAANRRRKFWKLRFGKKMHFSSSEAGEYRVVKGSRVPTTNSKEKIREAVKAAIY